MKGRLLDLTVRVWLHACVSDCLRVNACFFRVGGSDKIQARVKARVGVFTGNTRTRVSIFICCKVIELEIKKAAVKHFSMQQKQTKTHTSSSSPSIRLSLLPVSHSGAEGLINKAGGDCGTCSDKGCSLGESRNLSYHTVRGQRRAARLSAF